MGLFVGVSTRLPGTAAHLQFFPQFLFLYSHVNVGRGLALTSEQETSVVSPSGTSNGVFTECEVFNMGGTTE